MESPSQPVSRFDRVFRSGIFDLRSPELKSAHGRMKLISLSVGSERDVRHLQRLANVIPLSIMRSSIEGAEAALLVANCSNVMAIVPMPQ